MIFSRTLIFAAVSLFLCNPAVAALNVGDSAPDFSAQAAVGGKVFSFHLADALKQGPVVLYFFPKAFTAGCTIEAHDFADAADKYHEAGATLIGMSADDIDTEKEFTSKECRDKFPIAADPDLKVIRQYDATMIRVPGLFGVSSRISYVIAPGSTIFYVYDAPDPDKHVENTLEAIQKWRQSH